MNIVCKEVSSLLYKIIYCCSIKNTHDSYKYKHFCFIMIFVYL